MVILSKIGKDLMNTPNSIKSVLLILVLCLVSAGFLGSCAGGASKEFIIKVDERSQVYLPRLVKIIKVATPAQMESMLGKEIGAFKDASEEDMQSLKNALILDINSFLYMVQENRKLLKEKK